MPLGASSALPTREFADLKPPSPATSGTVLAQNAEVNAHIGQFFLTGKCAVCFVLKTHRKCGLLLPSVSLLLAARKSRLETQPSHSYVFEELYWSPELPRWELEGSRRLDCSEVFQRIYANTSSAFVYFYVQLLRGTRWRICKRTEALCWSSSIA